MVDSYTAHIDYSVPEGGGSVFDQLKEISQEYGATRNSTNLDHPGTVSNVAFFPINRDTGEFTERVLDIGEVKSIKLKKMRE